MMKFDKVRPCISRTHKKIPDASLVETKEIKISCGDEFMAPVDNSHGLPRRLFRAAPLKVADYLSSEKNKSRAIGFAYVEVKKREVAGSLLNGKKFRCVLDEGVERQVSPTIITCGAIYPLYSLELVVERTDDALYQIREFCRSLNTHQTEDRRGKLNYDKLNKLEKLMGLVADVYQGKTSDIIERVKRDDQNLGFFRQHFLERISQQVEKSYVKPRLKKFIEELRSRDVGKRLRLIKSFESDFRDYSWLCGARELIRRKERVDNKGELYVQQFGHRWSILADNVYVYDKSRRTFEPVNVFYQISEKVGLDVLAEPKDTMANKALAIVPVCPSLKLDKFVEVKNE